MHCFQIISLLYLIVSAKAFDCSAKELLAFNLQKIKGTYEFQISRSTPPSTRLSSWHLAVCDNTDSISDCPKNSDICGLTRLEFDDKDKPITSEIINFGSDLKPEISTKKVALGDAFDGFSLDYSGANWGGHAINGQVDFQCDKAVETPKLELVAWDDGVSRFLHLKLTTSSACAETTDKKPDDKPKPKPDDSGESWGWFTWIFIFMVLFLSIYIVGGAWFQYNKGNAIDFQSALKEVLDNFLDLLKGLPAFVKEIIEKFTGNSNRGEYSAV